MKNIPAGLLQLLETAESMAKKLVSSQDRILTEAMEQTNDSAFSRGRKGRANLDSSANASGGGGRDSKRKGRRARKDDRQEEEQLLDNSTGV